MEAVGLIVISKGRNIKAPQSNEGASASYYPGFATRFRPTQLMVSMSSASGVGLGQAREHFILQLPKKVIEVRTKSIKALGRKATGKRMKFEHTDKNRAMRADVKSLNKFFAGFELQGGSFSGYRRLFSNGNIERQTAFWRRCDANKKEK